MELGTPGRDRGQWRWGQNRCSHSPPPPGYPGRGAVRGEYKYMYVVAVGGREQRPRRVRGTRIVSCPHFPKRGTEISVKEAGGGQLQTGTADEHNVVVGKAETDSCSPGEGEGRGGRGARWEGDEVGEIVSSCVLAFQCAETAESADGMARDKHNVEVVRG